MSKALDWFKQAAWAQWLAILALSAPILYFLLLPLLIGGYGASLSFLGLILVVQCVLGLLGALNALLFGANANSKERAAWLCVLSFVVLLFYVATKESSSQPNFSRYELLIFGPLLISGIGFDSLRAGIFTSRDLRRISVIAHLQLALTCAAIVYFCTGPDRWS